MEKMVYHIPALLKETIDGLRVQPEGVYVDVTFGGGGHSRAILAEADRQQEEASKAKSGEFRLYSFDQDKDAMANAIDDERWTFVHSNFRYLSNWMDYYGEEQIDGLLADLGVSFHHFDSAERGFSFRFPGPLDMRMNQQARQSAADVLNNYTEEQLSQVLYLYGELKNARQIAKQIVRARQNAPIERTEQLVEILAGKKQMAEENGMIDITNPKAKKEMVLIFQALRMEVNDEIQVLREMLVAAKQLLRPGGRIAILTYHSLEDRLVKNFLRSGNLQGEIEKDFYGNVLSPFRLVNKNVIVASEEEVARNPRSRSAKLRIAEKI